MRKCAYSYIILNTTLNFNVRINKEKSLKIIRWGNKIDPMFNIWICGENSDYFFKQEVIY